MSELLESVFACNMNAIAAHERDAHVATAVQLFQAVQQVDELENGYAFRLPNDNTFLLKTSEFIANERLCCSFFGFTVNLEPNNGALWLLVTGADGIKPFIRAELGEALNADAARAANFFAEDE